MEVSIKQIVSNVQDFVRLYTRGSWGSLKGVALLKGERNGRMLNTHFCLETGFYTTKHY